MDEHEGRGRGGFRIAAGIMDFFGVFVNAGLILCLLLIMATLFGWLKQDLTETFGGIGENLNDAVVIEAPTSEPLQ